MYNTSAKEVNVLLVFVCLLMRKITQENYSTDSGASWGLGVMTP